MSVTFAVAGAGHDVERVPCTFGEGEEWACSPDARCGYCDNGLEERHVPRAPEVNMANVSAAAVLDVLGETSEPFGEWPLAQLPALRRRIVRALSTNQLAQHEQAAYAHGGPGTGHARVVFAGMDEARLSRRLRDLDTVLAAAQAAQASVVWG